MSDSVQPHRWQPIRLLHPWDSPGKSTGVGCHCLLWMLWKNPKKFSDQPNSILLWLLLLIFVFSIQLREYLYSPINSENRALVPLCVLKVFSTDFYSHNPSKPITIKVTIKVILEKSFSVFIP